MDKKQALYSWVNTQPKVPVFANATHCIYINMGCFAAHQVKFYRILKEMEKLLSYEYLTKLKHLLSTSHIRKQPQAEPLFAPNVLAHVNGLSWFRSNNHKGN